MITSIVTCIVLLPRSSIGLEPSPTVCSSLTYAGVCRPPYTRKGWTKRIKKRFRQQGLHSRS